MLMYRTCLLFLTRHNHINKALHSEPTYENKRKNANYQHTTATGKPKK